MTAPNESYPLSWPTGWPRTRRPGGSRFGNGWTLYKARQSLQHELRLLNASSVVLSTNIALRLDGLPYSNSKEPSDHGVAVYFRIKGEPRVLACDKWDRVVDNMVALAKHVEAIRGQLRWGVGSIEQAFGGYKALPEVGARKPWWDVLGVNQQAPWDAIVRKRIALMEIHHPDKGGLPGRAQEINEAFTEADRSRKAAP
jgi:hypothetical protein